MVGMSEFEPAQFRRLLDECCDLYVSSGQLCVREYPDLIHRREEDFVQLMDDLHRALLVKVFVTICEADRRWSPEEREGIDQRDDPADGAADSEADDR